jgi:hypothetical protein
MEGGSRGSPEFSSPLWTCLPPDTLSADYWGCTRSWNKGML